MPYTLPEKLTTLTPYEPDTSAYPVRMDANESFITPPPDLRARVNAAMAAVALNRYPDPAATELRTAFADLHGLKLRHVAAGNGSDELISVIMSAFLCRGDRLVTLEPDFSMYGFYAHLCECENLVYQKPDTLAIDVDEVIRLTRESDAKMLIFSNPCNPTSQGLPREEVRRLIGAVEALVILDEAYMDFWDQSLIDEVTGMDNCILLRTCSKMMGLAALRLGFAVAHEHLTRCVMAAKSPYNINAISAAAGAAVLRERDYLADCADRLVKSAKWLYNELIALKVPDFYVFVPCTNFCLIRTARAPALFGALKERGILVRQIDNHLRITAGNETENRALIQALTDIIKEVE